MKNRFNEEHDEDNAAKRTGSSLFRIAFPTLGMSVRPPDPRVDSEARVSREEIADLLQRELKSKRI